MTTDWFARLTGFRELPYSETRDRLVVDNGELVSEVGGQRFRVGELSVPTLADLRRRVAVPTCSRTTVRCTTGEARSMHANLDFAGALFQVASQFNLLEMTGPNVTPEDGVTRYSGDRTQGPACAVAAGAATIYRNYLAPVDGRAGQTADRQIDTLAGIGAALSQRLDIPATSLWTMRNGYALCSEAGLTAIAPLADDAAFRDELRSRLAIGVHADVQVTDVPVEAEGPRLVSQAFCSALPVAYGGGRPETWEPLARIVLEATYEATLLVAVERALAGGSRIVLLTRVGGGVFGNADAWIDDAIIRALSLVADAGLDVRLVSHGQVHSSFYSIAKMFSL